MSFPAPRIRRILVATVLAALTLAGAATAGMITSMRDVSAGDTADARAWPAAQASSTTGPISVAVVLGRSGTVGSDVLAPYEVFASSPRFSVYTVAETAAATPIEGGPALLPTHTFAEIDSGAAPSPDVVVVPAVSDPTGAQEATLRAWIVRQYHRGTSILGVCSGSKVLAATGLLEGHHATSHWTDMDALEETNPEVDWIRGRRYVQDGPIMTTAGVTSGIPGALKLVADLAGPQEAQRIGRSLHYPGWSLEAPTTIPEQQVGISDLSGRLPLMLPWFKPTVGIGVTDGVGEIDLAAAFEVYYRSFAARTLLVAPGDTVTTRHGIVLAATPTDDVERGVDRVIVPGATSGSEIAPQLRHWASALEVDIQPLHSPDGKLGFDAALEDLAAHAGRPTALAAAKVIDYPTDHLNLIAQGRAWRLPALLLSTLLIAIGVGVLATVSMKSVQRRRATPSSA